MIISKTFGVTIDKDIVRRVLAKHYRPQPGDGPCWLTFIGDHRVHASLNGSTPAEASGHIVHKQAKLQDFRWKTYCRDLVQLPLAA